MEYPDDSIIDFEKDDYYIKRGIAADVAAARGYRRYDEGNFPAVMDALYGEYPEYVQNWAEWCAGQVGREYDHGYTVPRFSPPEFPEISPGLKFQGGDIRNGAPKRHYHGLPVAAFALMPSFVSVAYAVPQKFGQVKIRYEHKHEGLSDEEKLQHGREFHTPSSTPKDGKTHSHTFYMIPENMVSDHVNGSVKGDAHNGINPQEIHTHQKRAKCVYTPSTKKDKHMGFKHDHDEMKEKDLKFHLEKYHSEEDDGTPD